MALPPTNDSRTLGLADPSLRRSLEDMVRRRVPAGEVDDIVQATLIDALAAASAPDEPEALRRWVFGIARHKIADHYRRSRRESPAEVPDVEAPSAPHSASDLLRWAERELPEGEGAEKTLEWMLREGEGEKLESIAEREEQPAPRVRQRVTRLRKHFRARWAAQVAAAAALLGIGLVLWWTLLRKPEDTVPPIARETPVEPSIARGEELRRAALERCTAQAWDDCVKGLDDAKRLDPAGDTRDDVVAARKAAADARAPSPPPSAVPSAPPTALPTTSPSSAPPREKDEPPTKTAPAKKPAKPTSSDSSFGSEPSMDRKEAPAPKAAPTDLGTLPTPTTGTGGFSPPSKSKSGGKKLPRDNAVLRGLMTKS